MTVTIMAFGLWLVQPESTSAYFIRSPCAPYRAEPITILPCGADLNLDGGVDIEDLLLFLAAYELGSLIADADYDGAVTIDDLHVFLNLFETG